MSRIAVVLASVLTLLLPASGRAAFHFSVIDELASGLGGDPTAQYVEIRTFGLPGQNFVKNTRLSAFNCNGSFAGVLLLVPNDVCHGQIGARWSMGTASWATLTGVSPDFTFSPGIPRPCGMICWGAPGAGFPPDPSTWDPSVLVDGFTPNYVDCVAYGGYTGTTFPSSGTPTPLLPGDGLTMTLTRTSQTGDNATDFALALASPTNNGPCPTTTTTSTSSSTSSSTSTSTSSSTTSSTLAEGGDQELSGRKLLLKVNADPTRTKVVAVSKDTGADLGGGNLSADDPVVNGGSLRVRTAAGDMFDATYGLPSSNWRYIGSLGANVGYKYTDPMQVHGPIKVAVVKPGKVVKAVGKGPMLTHTLATNPNPVDVVLRTGAKHFCMSFGGATAPIFMANSKYLATNASAPADCPP